MSIFKSTPAQISPSLRHLSPHESRSFLRRGKFSGDSVIFNHELFNLNARYLERVDLIPTYLTTFAGLDIALTPAFTAGNYTCALAFIRSDHQTFVASYYYDQLRGFWYYLPDYLMTSSSEQSPIERPGQGYHTESLRLPTTLQIALQDLPHIATELKPSSAIFCFVGTAKRFPNRVTFLQALQSGKLSDHPYYSNVQPKPALHLTSTSRTQTSSTTDTSKTSNSSKILPPSELILSGPSSPDFSTLQPSAYTTSTLFDRDISVDLCDSRDGNYQYNFCHDSANHAWLSAIEVKSDITPLALPSKWAALGAFGTPLYVDAVHNHGYGDNSDRRHGHYLNMWTNYLSQAPFIQAYLTAVKSSTS